MNESALDLGDGPWCDTCHDPAVWSEGQGWLHSTAGHRFGLPRRLDDSGHEVTARQWNVDPYFPDGSS